MVQWIDVVVTVSPIGDHVVFEVSLVHRIIKRLTLRVAETLAVIGERSR